MKRKEKVDEETNALCEEIARVQMRSPSLVNTDYFLSNLQFLNVSLFESAPRFIER